MAEFRLTNDSHSALGFYFSDFTPEVSWKGIAIANMNATGADVKLYALGNDSILGCKNISIAPRSKDVGLYTKWFPYVNFADIKEIVAVSTAPLCGVSISGNGGNSFLLFTSAAEAVGFNPVFDCSAPKPEAIGTIGKYGGIIEVKDPDSPIYGAKLVIPEGTIEENISFKINIPDNDDLPFPVGLESVSRAIEFLPEGIQYGGQGAKLYIPLTNPEEFESVDDIWVLTNESGSDRWTFEANVSLGENKKFIVFETTHNSSKKAVKKPKIDFSESVLSDEIFNLKSDAFNAKNKNNTCDGVAFYTAWYLNYIGHGLQCKYTRNISEEIMLKIHNNSKPYRRYQSFHSAKWAAEKLIYRLQEDRESQLLLMYGTFAHAINVVGWDAEKKVFNVYENTKEEMRELGYNPATGAFDLYDDWIDEKECGGPCYDTFVFTDLRESDIKLSHDVYNEYESKSMSDDPDHDGINCKNELETSCDNCPSYYNPDQKDADKDGVGDSCDNCPLTPVGEKVDENGCSDTTWYIDSDGDGYGSSTESVKAVSQPTGYVHNNNDLDDNNPTVHPGAEEICNDNIDNDQDGKTDENCGLVDNSKFFGIFDYRLSGTQPYACANSEAFSLESDYSKLNGSCNYLYIPLDMASTSYDFFDCDGDHVFRTITISENSIRWSEKGECSGVPSPCWSSEYIINFAADRNSGTISGTNYDEDPNFCQGDMSGTFTRRNAIGGLVAHYPFNENVNDVSGNGNNGIPYGGLSYGGGVTGQAARFDGINDYVKINSRNAVSSEDFTITAWVNTSSEHHILSQWSAGNVQDNFIFRVKANNYLGLSLRRELDIPFTTSSTLNIPPGQWLFVAVSYDDSTGQGTFYVNTEKERFSSGIPNRDVYTSADVCIGKKRFNDEKYGTGSLDEVRIFDRALSDDDILSIYNLK